jgi:hypothetical protein
MATNPTFDPDQDMSDVSPEDVQAGKQRAKQTSAFNAADKTPPNPKNLPNVTKDKLPSSMSKPKNLPTNMKDKVPASMLKPVNMAKGGSASSRADGIAQQGKTRGTMIMCGGGMARGKK